MDWGKFIPVLLSVLISIIGWVIVHRLTQKRDIEKAKKELRIKYLIETWKNLEYASHRHDIDKREYFERPLAEIQLFGTLKQIELAQKVIEDMDLYAEANYDELLYDLRNNLREELDLEQVPNKIKQLRMNIKN